MDDRVVLGSGYIGVRLPDGRRLLEKPPQGVIMEGRNPGPFGTWTGQNNTFRIMNVNGQAYVLQYSQNDIPIVLPYNNDVDGDTVASFEGPPGSSIGIVAAGGNMGHVDGWVPKTLFAPTVEQPIATVAPVILQSSTRPIAPDGLMTLAPSPTPAPDNQPLVPPAQAPIASPGYQAPIASPGYQSQPSFEVAEPTMYASMTGGAASQSQAQSAEISPRVIGLGLSLLFLLFGGDE